jgi:hypothetical protein
MRARDPEQGEDPDDHDLAEDGNGVDEKRDECANNRGLD